MKKSIMNKFREWLIADYEQRLGHVSKSTVNHRITQINFLLTKPASQYNCFDRKCLGYSINKFLEFYVNTTLNRDENSEFINMMNNISVNINK
jgi:hypothetical protein